VLDHYGLRAVLVPTATKDRPLTKADNEAAWNAADGTCTSCGGATIWQRQYDRLLRLLPKYSDLFDLHPLYINTKGRAVPLWSARVLIAAKGVADHMTPRSCGGGTTASNLANVCAAFNYSCSNTSLDAVRVAVHAS
jgi:hypothetical protein